MKKTVALFCMSSMILGSASVASADMSVVRGMPSPALVSAFAGKTFDARITGYGWGEEDDASSLNLDFTIVEPLTYSAAEIEALEAGDNIIAGYEVYTVSAVEKEEGAIKVTPEEEWMAPLTFTANDAGAYTAENEEGVLRADTFSFPACLGEDLVYVNAEGEQLTAADLLKGFVDGSFDPDSCIPKITFDENGYVVELNLSE